MFVYFPRICHLFTSHTFLLLLLKIPTTTHYITSELPLLRSSYLHAKVIFIVLVCVFAIFTYIFFFYIFAFRTPFFLPFFFPFVIIHFLDIITGPESGNVNFDSPDERDYERQRKRALIPNQVRIYKSTTSSFFG